MRGVGVEQRNQPSMYVLIPLLCREAMLQAEMDKLREKQDEENERQRMFGKLMTSREKEVIGVSAVNWHLESAFALQCSQFCSQLQAERELHEEKQKLKEELRRVDDDRKMLEVNAKLYQYKQNKCISSLHIFQTSCRRTSRKRFGAASKNMRRSWRR